MPSGFMNALEALVEFIRDTIAKPNVGRKWVNTYTPLLLTFFVFIFSANAIGLIPLFDVLGLLNHFVIHADERVVPGEGHPRRHDVDGELQRHRRAGDHHVLLDHRRRHQGARLRQALDEPGAARPRLAALHPADSDRADGHVRQAVRTHHATCGEHDGWPHRHPGDSVVRVHVHGDVQSAHLPASVSGWRCRCRSRSASRRSRSSSSWCRRTCSPCCRRCSSAWPFTFITKFEFRLTGFGFN